MNDILDDASAATGVPVNEWAVVPADAFVFSSDLLNYCKTNSCGEYNKSWTCPPDCEEMEAQKR